MNRYLYILIIGLLFTLNAQTQNLSEKANAFINLLDSAKRSKLLYPFDTIERYHFNYVPLNDRKGISYNELNFKERNALMDLLKLVISSPTLAKITAIMQLEMLLKELEKRELNDHYRDSGKYFITIFGVPEEKSIWSWRFEGHHVAFNFSANKNELVSGTPNFLGSNPAIVLDGSQKNKEILKDETNYGFGLLHALNEIELKSALINSSAPNEIITTTNRKAIIENPSGVRYADLTVSNQQLLLQLIKIYLNRFTKPFASIMLKEIVDAGLDKLWFAWAGSFEKVIGKAYYYRIQGATIIIEYDNSQNNANHIHTVIRDLKNDFGGDLLLEHYRLNHQ